MISPAGQSTKQCRSCANNSADRWCKAYVDDITAMHADLTEARSMCRGAEWKEREWTTATDSPSVTVTTAPDKIETHKATVYITPPLDKLLDPNDDWQRQKE